MPTEPRYNTSSKKKKSMFIATFSTIYANSQRQTWSVFNILGIGFMEFNHTEQPLKGANEPRYNTSSQNPKV